MKNIFITGASKGIGKQLVRAFAIRGHQVSFTYRSSSESAKDLVVALNAEGFENIRAFQCDMSNEEEVKRLFRDYKDLFKDVDVLINNAGIRDSKLNASPKPFIMTTSKEWWEVMYNNMNGVINSCRAVLPSMIKRRSGRIINVTSLAGIKGNPGQSAYASSKAAINCFSKSLSKEVGGMSVTINCVAPGFVETEMVEHLPNKYVTDRVGNSLLKRMGTTDEISNLITYLALDAPSFFVNQEVIIDGGMN